MRIVKYILLQAAEMLLALFISMVIFIILMYTAFLVLMGLLIIVDPDSVSYTP